MLDDPSVRGIVVNFREVTQRRALQDELVHQAFHDSPTGLANRALLIDRLGHALTSASARGGRVALLYLDLVDSKIENGRASCRERVWRSESISVEAVQSKKN